jgi:DNA-binding response OmpR family regulator
MIKILIYETNTYWIEVLKLLPYELDFCITEEEIYQKTSKIKYDFYLFDFSGYAILKELKNSGDKTISIFLSNYEDFNSQKKAYKIADEFFKKSSTYIEEIQIKIDYYIKKLYNLSDTIKYNNIYFYLNKNIIYKNNKRIDLTVLEKELLILFFKYKNRYLNKHEICERLSITEGSLKVKITQLRKFGFDIKNKREIGYKLKEKK